MACVMGSYNRLFGPSRVGLPSVSPFSDAVGIWGSASYVHGGVPCIVKMIVCGTSRRAIWGSCARVMYFPFVRTWSHFSQRQ